jgi:TM2 domain-containing membrane protein YozV
MSNLQTSSRTLALLGQAFFGFTGLTRIYLGSYVIGIVQFLLFVTAMAIFSQTTTTPATFMSATAVMLLLTAIWVADSLALGGHCLRASPAPIWSTGYVWTNNRFDMLSGMLLGGLTVVIVPIFIGVWLFMPETF